MATTAVVTTERSATPARIWGGRVLTALPILALGMSAAMKLSQSPDFVEKWTNGAGFPASTLVPIGILEVLVMAIYAIPRTRILGAILVAGYLGGAMVTHIRVGQPFIVPLVLGIFAWAGVWLSDPRLSALLPLRAPIEKE